MSDTIIEVSGDSTTVIEVIDNSVTNVIETLVSASVIESVETLETVVAIQGPRGEDGTDGDVGIVNYEDIEGLPDLTLKADQTDLVSEINDRTDADTALSDRIDDKADQTALDAHIDDTTAAHIASAILFDDSPLTVFSGTSVQAIVVSADAVVQSLYGYVDDADTALSVRIDDKADLVGGTVPSSQLPSYVDDVLNFANLAAFPGTGEAGKIYLAEDTNLPYRWSGSTYVVLNPSLALGETSSTAYRGDRGKIAYDHSQVTGNPHGTTKTDLGLGNVDNTSDASKPISTAQAAVNALKAPLASPTFTGVVTVPTPVNPTDASTKDFVDVLRTDTGTAVGSLSTAITNLNTALGNEITARVAADSALAPLANPTFTGTVAGITKSMVGLGNVDNTADTAKPVSTAQATAIALKANIASPTFTGTVSGITKTMVGLGNVDNNSTATILASAASASKSADTITDGTTNKSFLTTERTKLTGIATGATVNSSDATLLSRTNHTGFQAASTITGLSAVATSGSAADLTGILPTSSLPALAISETTVVASQAAMLALTAQRGDVAIRTDLSKTFILSTDSPTTLADWKEFLTPGAGVSTVNGYVGTVVLVKGDIGLGNVDNTADASKPVSTAQATAIALKADLASPTFTGTVSGITKSMVGLGNVDNTSNATERAATATLSGKTIDGGSNTLTNIAQSSITGLSTALGAKAPLASPTFTGVVTVPTPVNATDASTKDYVDTLRTDTGTAVGTLTTASTNLNTAITNEITARTNADALLAPIASPTFTGTVSGITKSMVGLGNVDNTSNATERAAAATLTNKRVTKRVVSTTSTGTLTIDSDSYDAAALTAQAAALTVAAPTGTPTDFQQLLIRIKDDGTARAITWNSIFRIIGTTLPTTTVLGKVLYIGLMYNAAVSKWDVVAVGQEA